MLLTLHFNENDEWGTIDDSDLDNLHSLGYGLKWQRPIEIFDEDGNLIGIAIVKWNNRPGFSPAFEEIKITIEKLLPECSSI